MVERPNRRLRNSRGGVNFGRENEQMKMNSLRLFWCVSITYRRQQQYLDTQVLIVVYFHTKQVVEGDGNGLPRGHRYIIHVDTRGGEEYITNTALRGRYIDFY